MAISFDEKYEDSVLSQCLKDEAFLKRATSICEAHIFSTKERSWLWTVIHDNWKSYRERTTAKIVIARAESEFDKSKRAPYLALAKKVFRKKTKNPKTILGELDKFVRHVNVQIAIEKGAELLEKNKVDEAEKVISKATRSIVRQRIYTHIPWIENFEARQTQRKYEKEHPEEYVTIPLGFPKIDKTLSGGGRKGELGLIIGTTGRGKSIFLTNVAMTCVTRGFNAIYFGFEMPARQLATRQDSRWSGIKYDRFKEYNFKPSEIMRLSKRIKKAKKKFRNRLHIVSMPVRSANILDVRNAIDDIRQDYGFEADAIFLDSADHLRSLEGYGSNYRLQQAEVYWSAKELAEEDGYFVMSSTQAGKEWVKRIATAEATSEAYDKSRIADLVLSLNDPSEIRKKGRKTIVQDDDDDDDYENDEEIDTPTVKEGSRLLELFMSKYRDGDSKFKVDLECDFSRILMKEIEKDDDDEEGEDDDD